VGICAAVHETDLLQDRFADDIQRTIEGPAVYLDLTAVGNELGLENVRPDAGLPGKTPRAAVGHIPGPAGIA